MSTIIIKNGTLVTLGEKLEVLTKHFIYIQGEKVKGIFSNKLLSEYKADKIIDAEGKVVLPGFINTHMHYYSSMVRGLGKAEPSKNFSEVLNNLWWRLDKKLTHEDSYYSTLIANISSIKAGTTTIIDHHASPNAVTGSLDVIAKAVKESGLRANLCYELSDRDGKKISQEGIEENINFIQRCQKENDPQLRALFGMHASFTLEEETLEKAYDLSKDLNTGFHIHCAEDISDQVETVKKTGKRVIERLFDHHLLGSKTILAHGIHLNDHELHIIHETDTPIIHNPQSNMNNAVGVAKTLKISELGITLGLGTDAMTSNMLEELRSALWISKLTNKNPSVGFMESCNALLNGNREIANRHWEGMGLGEIKEGSIADIVIMDYYSPTPFNSDTFLGHLIFGISQSVVDTTIASGKILMENKLLTTLNEQEIMAKANELSHKLWERF